MVLRYPRKWASFDGYTQKRLDIETAVQFIDSLQSHQFGQLLDLQANYEEYPNGAERDIDIEKQLQDDLQETKEWLQSQNQKTISRKKVINKIEENTGYEFEFTD